MTSHIYVEVPDKLKERLRLHAYQHSRTQAQVVQDALTAYLAKHGAKPAKEHEDDEEA